MMIMVGCLGILTAQTYRVGDVYTAPDGSKGIVFYLHPDGTGGWVVALNDDTTACKWGPSTDVSGLANQNPTNLQQLLYDTSGYANTQAMLATPGYGSTNAAGVVDFAHGWYLPAPGQLRILFGVYPLIKDAILDAGGSIMSSSNYFYWSSAEHSANQAWQVDFSEGSTRGSFNHVQKSREKA